MYKDRPVTEKAPKRRVGKWKYPPTLAWHQYHTDRWRERLLLTEKKKLTNKKI
jgi:hypothetical protein